MNPKEIVLLTFVTILDFGEAKSFQQSNFFGDHRYVFFPAVNRPSHRDCADWSFVVIFLCLNNLALPRAIDQNISIEPRIKAF